MLDSSPLFWSQSISGTIFPTHIHRSIWSDIPYPHSSIYLERYSLPTFIDLSGTIFPIHIHRSIWNDIPYPHSSITLLIVCFFSKGCDVTSVSKSDMISDHFSVVVDSKIPTGHSRTVTSNYHLPKVTGDNHCSL